MFSPFNANAAANQALRTACRRAAENEARARTTAPSTVEGRRTTLAMLCGGWVLALASRRDDMPEQDVNPGAEPRA